jgi:hypothetical protein
VFIKIAVGSRCWPRGQKSCSPTRAIGRVAAQQHLNILIKIFVF